MRVKKLLSSPESASQLCELERRIATKTIAWSCHSKVKIICESFVKKDALPQFPLLTVGGETQWTESNACHQKTASEASVTLNPATLRTVSDECIELKRKALLFWFRFIA